MRSFLISSVVVIIFVGVGLIPVLVFLSPPAHAQVNTMINLSTLNPLTCTDLNCVLQAIIKGIVGLAPPVVAIMVLIGGYQIVTAGGDPKKLQSGKQTVLWAAIGFAIIIIAQGVALVIQDVLN